MCLWCWLAAVAGQFACHKAAGCHLGCHFEVLRNWGDETLLAKVSPLSLKTLAVNLPHIPTLRQAGALTKTSLHEPLQAQHDAHSLKQLPPPAAAVAGAALPFVR